MTAPAGPALLPEPFEWLELGDGRSARMAIKSFTWGQGKIKPRYAGAPEEKTIPVLRLEPKEGYKPTGAPYWDLSSKTLQARIRPHLEDLVKSGREFVITAHGTGRSKRFSLEIP